MTDYFTRSSLSRDPLGGLVRNQPLHLRVIAVLYLIPNPIVIPAKAGIYATILLQTMTRTKHQARHYF